MKLLLAGAALALVSFGTALAQSDHYVSGYTRKDGTYVAPHYQTNPNNARADNYSTQGNVNPYTGQPGTKPLYEPTPSYTPRPSYAPAPRPNPYATPNPYAPAKTCLYGQPC
jgi:hypothetical protein